MKTKLRSTSIFLFCLLSVPVWGSDPVVTVRGIPPSETVMAGNLAVIAVELKIREQFHINSNKPLEDYLIPTSLEFEPVPGVEFGNIRFPVSEIKQFPFTDTPMAVYEGVVRIPVELTPDGSLSGKDVVLKGKVHYQACNDSTCLPPAQEPFTVQISVEGGSGIANGVSQAATSTKQPGDRIEIFGIGGSARENLPVYFLLVFLGGLALNMTPCVYPMIPITITYFGGQAQGKRGNLLAHSVLYVVGMAITYSVLGVVAALTGGLFSAALRYPPVLIGIALVMLLLALSMFDIYELRMPSFLNRLAGGTRKGYAGTFLMGLTVGIVAAPCIGPVVLSLLISVGNRGSAVFGFFIFFVLAIGMGIPFLILGIFSGSIHRLPRSGDWMVWVRKVFGFILLAMALYFLKTLFPSPLFFSMSLASLLVLAGIYLAWLAPVATSGKGFAWFRNIIGIGFFVSALIIAVPGLHRAAGVDWRPFSEQLLGEASREGKPVLIDFYADWCAPCKELDKDTFTAPEIIELSRQFVMVKVDLTVAGNPVADKLQEKYRIPGVPTLLFLKPDLSELEELRVTGFTPPDVFLPKMKEAYGSSMEGMKGDT